MRLIDADALKKEFPKDSDWEYPVNTNSYVCKTIDAQPTIEEHKTGLWIPCSERLPEYGKNVLITNSKGNVSYGRFRGVEFWKEDGDNYWTWKKNTIEHVLAWMPLPEPYREEREDYELATEQMEHDAMYEPTYNSEDGSM